MWLDARQLEATESTGCERLLCLLQVTRRHASEKWALGEFALRWR